MPEIELLVVILKKYKIKMSRKGSFFMYITVSLPVIDG